MDAETRMTYIDALKRRSIGFGEDERGQLVLTITGPAAVLAAEEGLEGAVADWDPLAEYPIGRPGVQSLADSVPGWIETVSGSPMPTRRPKSAQ
jgi:hypothetical protein